MRYCHSHRGRFGRPGLLGLTWQGRAFDTVGEVCPRCRAGELRELGLIDPTEPASSSLRPAGKGILMGVLVAAATFVARPLDSPPAVERPALDEERAVPGTGSSLPSTGCRPSCPARAADVTDGMART